MKVAALTLAATLLGTALLTGPTPVHAQGCAQCRDNTAATPPATREAYRRAIFLLGGTAGLLFIVSVGLVRRYR